MSWGLKQTHHHLHTDHSWKTCNLSWNYSCPSLAWQCLMGIVLHYRTLKGSHMQGCLAPGARQEPDEQVVGNREVWLVL